MVRFATRMCLLSLLASAGAIESVAANRNAEQGGVLSSFESTLGKVS
jgi:hypothetical protein